MLRLKQSSQKPSPAVLSLWLKVLKFLSPENNIVYPEYLSYSIVLDGDMITIDSEHNIISMAVSDEEIKARLSQWKAPPLKVNRGHLAKYVRLVSDASHGAVLDAFD